LTKYKKKIYNINTRFKNNLGGVLMIFAVGLLIVWNLILNYLIYNIQNNIEIISEVIEVLK